MDSFRLYPRVPSVESDTRVPEYQNKTEYQIWRKPEQKGGSLQPKEFEILMQKFEQIELQARARDVEKEKLSKELQTVKKIDRVKAMLE